MTQKQQIKFNINHYISFELTKQSAEVYNNCHNKWIARTCENPKKAGDVVKMQMWMALELFSNWSYLGSEAWCKNCEIILEV